MAFLNSFVLLPPPGNLQAPVMCSKEEPDVEQGVRKPSADRRAGPPSEGMAADPAA